MYERELNNRDYTWTKEQEVNLERFASFMANMYIKYKNEINIIIEELGVESSTPSPQDVYIYLIIYIICAVIVGKVR